MQCLRAPPTSHLCVIAAAQNLWDRPAPELGGARVLGFLQQAGVTKTLRDRAHLVAHRAGQQPHHSLDDQARCDLATRENHIADRQFVVDEVLADPVVDTLGAATEQAETTCCGEFVGDGLIKATAAGAEQEQRPRWINRFDRRKDRTGRHHHARSPAERRVVHGSMGIGGVLTQIVTAQVEQSAGSTLSEQALAAEAIDQAGEDSEDVDTHCVEFYGPFGRSGIQIEQAVRRIDGRHAIDAAQHECHRHERACIEFEDVVSGIRKNADTTAAIHP